MIIMKGKSLESNENTWNYGVLLRGWELS